MVEFIQRRDRFNLHPLNVIRHKLCSYREFGGSLYIPKNKGLVSCVIKELKLRVIINADLLLAQLSKVDREFIGFDILTILQRFFETEYFTRDGKRNCQYFTVGGSNKSPYIQFCCHKGEVWEMKESDTNYTIVKYFMCPECNTRQTRFCRLRSFTLINSYLASYYDTSCDERRRPVTKGYYFSKQLILIPMFHTSSLFLGKLFPIPQIYTLISQYVGNPMVIYPSVRDLHNMCLSCISTQIRSGSLWIYLKYNDKWPSYIRIRPPPFPQYDNPRYGDNQPSKISIDTIYELIKPFGVVQRKAIAAG